MYKYVYGICSIKKPVEKPTKAAQWVTLTLRILVMRIGNFVVSQMKKSRILHIPYKCVHIHTHTTAQRQNNSLKINEKSKSKLK